MKNLIILVITLLLQVNLLSQSSYIELTDASGIDRAPFRNELTIKASELIQAFPTEFQNQFKVIDFGFYIHNESMMDGFETFWEKSLQEASDTSEYYLLFGKQSDSEGIYTKFWIDLKLPSTGQFECLDLISPTLREELVKKYNIQSNRIYDTYGREFNKYADVEVEIMSILKEFVIGAMECCAPASNAKSGNVCSACVYEATDVLALQKERQFIFDPIQIVEDLDYFETSLSAFNSKPTKESNQSKNGQSLDIEIRLADGSEIDLDAYVNTFFQEEQIELSGRFGITTSVSLHTYKFPRDCGLFESKWSAFEEDNSKMKAFVALTNVNNEWGFLGFTMDTRDLLSEIGGSSSAKSISDPELQILEDELEGVKEIEEDYEKPCKELAGYYSNIFGKALMQQQRGFTGQGEWNEEHQSMYDELILTKIDEAQYELSVYFNKEYFIIEQVCSENEDIWSWCHISTKWRTSYRLCAGVIHTALSACEAIQGLGTVCGIANATLYCASGELGNAALSIIGAVPLGSIGKYGTKFAVKLWKPVGGCVVGASNAKGASGYCRALSITVNAAGNIKWVGGRSKLQKLIVGHKEQIDYYFAGAKILYDGAKHNVHHLIPWELCKTATQHRIMRRLVKSGEDIAGEIKTYSLWHASDPVRNGFIIPKHFDDGVRVFHDSHGAYNRWVDDALTRMNIGIVDDIILGQKLDKLTLLLKSKIEEAYETGSKLGDYFESIARFELEDLI